MGRQVALGQEIDLVHGDEEQAAQDNDIHEEQKREYHPVLDGYLLSHGRPPFPRLSCHGGADSLPQALR